MKRMFTKKAIEEISESKVEEMRDGGELGTPLTQRIIFTFTGDDSNVATIPEEIMNQMSLYRLFNFVIMDGDVNIFFQGTISVSPNIYGDGKNYYSGVGYSEVSSVPIVYLFFDSENRDLYLYDGEGTGVNFADANSYELTCYPII